MFVNGFLVADCMIKRPPAVHLNCSKDLVRKADAHVHKLAASKVDIQRRAQMQSTNVQNRMHVT